MVVWSIIRPSNGEDDCFYMKQVEDFFTYIVNDDCHDFADIENVIDGHLIHGP